LNDKRIQQVLDIEQQAQAAYETAVNEAKLIPQQAEQDAQLIIDKARAEAEAEAKQILAKAQAQDESAQIMTDAEDKVRRNEVVAQGNFNRAVADVLSRVVGKE
jgi:F0F1-type ATP synthase membrane subunit b/b'